MLNRDPIDDIIQGHFEEFARKVPEKYIIGSDIHRALIYTSPGMTTQRVSYYADYIFVPFEQGYTVIKDRSHDDVAAGAILEDMLGVKIDRYIPGGRLCFTRETMTALKLKGLHR
jgi:hypothetical protein